MLPLQKRITSLLIVSLVWSSTASISVQANNTQPTATTLPIETEIQTIDSLKLAHAEDGNIEFNNSIIAGHIGQASYHDDVEHSDLSDSLWVNMALTMAYHRDPVIQKIMKKNHRLAQAGSISAIALSGMGMSSSILSLATLNSGGGSHSEDEHDHGPVERDNPTSSVIGVVGSGLSLVVLGSQMFFRHRYKKQLLARQQLIKADVEYGIEHITEDLGKTKLKQLIGPRATKELIDLFQHP